MFTLVIVLTMLTGSVKTIESIVIPGFETKIDCINARVMASQQFALMDDGVTISSKCFATPGSTT